MTNDGQTPDGGQWQHLGFHPDTYEVGAGTPQTLPDPSLILHPEDILAVRGIESIDPPVDEHWVVVTLAVRERWPQGGGPKFLDLGGRLLGRTDPPEPTPPAGATQAQATLTMEIPASGTRGKVVIADTTATQK